MSRFDIYGIGNALLDTEYSADDEFLAQNNIEKGRMTLIDPVRRRELLNAVDGEPSSVRAGGSAANAIYASQGFGCRCYFAGVAFDDDVGQAIQKDFANAGIESLQPVSDGTGNSGQCLIFVTEDGQRSMNTCLGISETLDTHHVNEEIIADSSWVFIEGYLASSPTGRKAAQAARELAQANNVKTSLTLADVSMVTTFREPMNDIFGDSIDLVFCNIDEALAWCDTDRLDIATKQIVDIARCAVITESEKGCYVVTPDGLSHTEGFAVYAVDSNGAGDMFAGAFLASIHQGASLNQAARFANYAASHTVRQYGPRLRSLGSYTEISFGYR